MPGNQKKTGLVLSLTMMWVPTSGRFFLQQTTGCGTPSIFKMV